MYPPINHKLSGANLGQTIMAHHVEGLVTGYLEQYPDFLESLLQKHELWLAGYLRDRYNLDLPSRKGILLKHQAYISAPTSRQPETAPQASTRSINSASSERSAQAPRKPENLPQTSNQATQNHYVQDHHARANIIQESTNYQKPIVENGTSYESAGDDRGDSPKSNSSQISSWPTEEDLGVPYPTPDEKLQAEVGMIRGNGHKWTFEEQDLAIGYMYNMRDDPNMPKTEERFHEVSRRMKQEYGYERSKNSVKNMWNRIGRHRSGFDERKNKSAPLATSLQGKHARMENEAKKRKASAEPPAAEPVEKRTKTTTQMQPTYNQSSIDPALNNDVADLPTPNYMSNAYLENYQENHQENSRDWSLLKSSHYGCATDFEQSNGSNVPSSYVHIGDVEKPSRNSIPSSSVQANTIPPQQIASKDGSLCDKSGIPIATRTTASAASEPAERQVLPENLNFDFIFSCQGFEFGRNAGLMPDDDAGLGVTLDRYNHPEKFKDGLDDLC